MVNGRILKKINEYQSANSLRGVDLVTNGKTEESTASHTWGVGMEGGDNEYHKVTRVILLSSAKDKSNTR